MLSATRFPSPRIDLSGEEDANSHESCETLAACHSPSGMLPSCSSCQIHSCHQERVLDSNVVRSVSLPSGSVSCGAALLPAALPVAGVAGALGSSLGGGGVARGAGVRVAWGVVEGGFLAPVFHSCSQYTHVMICVALHLAVLIRVWTRRICCLCSSRRATTWIRL